jgi:hypothetical protein
VEGEALSRPPPDPGQSRELHHEVLDGGTEHDESLAG